MDDNIKKMNIQLSSSLYNYFKSLLREDHEKAGELTYKYDKKNNVYKLDIVKKNVRQNKGILDKVTPVVGDITYHTHPNIAYVKHNTPFGWPSTIDYVILLDHFKNMKLHIVVSKEGLWVICFHRDWIQYRNLDECSVLHVKKFIEKKWDSINLDIPSWCKHCSVKKTFQEYKKQINSIYYEKNNKKIRIFKVYLKEW